MTLFRRQIPTVALLSAMVAVLALSAAPSRAGERVAYPATDLAQAGGTEPRELEPRYQPAPVEEKGWYNDSYIFALTRGVADSTMHPAAKAPLFVLTVPLDLVFLPITAIGGLFG
jgi:hypothetical protein